MASTLLRGHFYTISNHGPTQNPDEPILLSVREQVQADIDRLNPTLRKSR